MQTHKKLSWYLDQTMGTILKFTKIANMPRVTANMEILFKAISTLTIKFMCFDVSLSTNLIVHLLICTGIQSTSHVVAPQCIKSCRYQ